MIVDSKEAKLLRRKKAVHLERNHRLLVEAVEVFLESKRAAPDEHDWSQCRSDAQVERRMKAGKYTISDAGCAFATLEEKLGRYR